MGEISSVESQVEDVFARVAFSQERVSLFVSEVLHYFKHKLRFSSKPQESQFGFYVELRVFSVALNAIVEWRSEVFLISDRTFIQRLINCYLYVNSKSVDTNSAI